MVSMITDGHSESDRLEGHHSCSSLDSHFIHFGYFPLANGSCRISKAGG